MKRGCRTAIAAVLAFAVGGGLSPVLAAGREFQFGNAYLHEEGIPRVIWKGGETFVRTHSLAGRSFREARLAVTIYNYKKGKVLLAASTNGADWVELPPAVRQGLHRCALPAGFFPCGEVFVRAEAEKGSSLRFAHYQVAATVDGPARTLLPPREQVSTNWLFRADYGELLPADSPGLRLWRADSGWRIPRRRTVPSARAEALEICAAANEAEAAQLVVTPERHLEDVRVRLCGALEGEGANLPASCVDIFRVGYVPVRIPTDGSCVAADYPDPLPPQDGDAFPVAAGENQPFWVRVKPPKGVPPGIYRGEIEVSGLDGGGRGWSERVTLAVRVFGFALPETMTCRSMLGLDLNNVRRYHRLNGDAEEREILERYLKTFADCRISPYNPAPLAKWDVEWKGDEPVFRWDEWDRDMAHAFDTYHFNAFRLNVDGLGGGNSISHKRRSIGGVHAGDARYDVRMKAYLGGIERHLRERGWLDKAVVYWFDEPDAKDYQYVKSGFDILRRYAPGIARAITEEPVAGLLGGPDIWCAHTHRLHDHPEALAAARARADSVWWYLCWLPKAPYATLFIDHPAVEMRTWLWQTWKENVSGVLIWQVNHWQSSYLYAPAGQLQDPYLDPMSRHSHGKCFGNGDGTLLYPPKNRLDGPVASIRLEMLRDGIEDYEYFAILKRKAGDTSPLLEVPPDVTESLTRFSADPRPILRHRRRIAEAIERRP